MELLNDRVFAFLFVIFVTIFFLFLVTLIYKKIPYRKLGKKPFLSFFPKYKNSFETIKNINQLESTLNAKGFVKSASKGKFLTFKRGSILGDYSIDKIKISLRLLIPENGKTEIFVQASWLIAFDTGDLWTLTSEITKVLESS